MRDRGRCHGKERMCKGVVVLAWAVYMRMCGSEPLHAA